MGRFFYWLFTPDCHSLIVRTVCDDFGTSLCGVFACHRQLSHHPKKAGLHRQTGPVLWGLWPDDQCSGGPLVIEGDDMLGLGKEQPALDEHAGDMREHRKA